MLFQVKYLLKSLSTFTHMQNPSLELQRNYEAKLIRKQLLLCFVSGYFAAKHFTNCPPLPLQKRQPICTTLIRKLLFWLDCAGDPGEAVVPKNIIVRDFGSLVYYGVAKISLSWVWHPRGGGVGGGHLGNFWVGMCCPGLQNGTPF